MENYDVAVVRCKTYNVEAVNPTLFRSKSPMQPQQPILPCLRHLLKCFWHAVQMLR